MTRHEILRRLEAAGAVARLAEAAARRDAGLPPRGDHDLNPGMPRRDALRPAAVLVPLVDHAEELTVLLTQRTEHLTVHAGQISFPGGRIDPEDAGAVDAALRETEEEVGVPRDRVEIVAQLDDYETRTGFRITPVVGLIRPPYPVDPDPFEVADVFEVPLSFVLHKENHRRLSRVYEGVERHFYVLPYKDRYIWGATAGMLVHLSEILVDK